MTVCLVATKRGRKRELNIISRGSTTDTAPSSVNSLEFHDDEVVHIRRGVFFILLVGLLPIYTWLFIHIFFPDLLTVQITPKL